MGFGAVEQLHAPGELALLGLGLVPQVAVVVLVDAAQSRLQLGHDRGDLAGRQRRDVGRFEGAQVVAGGAYCPVNWSVIGCPLVRIAARTARPASDQNREPYRDTRLSSRTRAPSHHPAGLPYLPASIGRERAERGASLGTVEHGVLGAEPVIDRAAPPRPVQPAEHGIRLAQPRQRDLEPHPRFGGRLGHLRLSRGQVIHPETSRQH